ncbi:MAG TPA: alpha-amylase family protein [Acidimicrobiia bacterium]|nr:alpha-amylase family protein [Acidimicrobiia bacterium]
MSTTRTSDLWWKNAVIYCLDVDTYLDWDGDGVGDIEGLIERVDYLAGLGVTCLWLMPFQPSPGRDDGYDITDYYAVDPRLGSLGDFVAFIRTAKDRGLKVIIDLVVNHTSDRHPWFKASRASQDSPYRDFYVWREEPAEEPKSEPVFPDAEDSIWTRDEKAGMWYLHHFYSHQPDLNIANPEVREEIARIAGFWLQLGVDGFRVDAVPFLLETGGIPGAEELDPHDLLADLRSFVSRRNGSAVLLGEVNLPPDDLVTYFGEENGNELHMLTNFPVMQTTYLALARRDAQPLADALRALPEIPDDSQWANFVRNHDELTLDQLTAEEREEVFAAFGPEEEMRIFDRGIRRRLPPMFDGDQQRIRLAYSLLFTLPGTPVLFYGEEIGMGENLEVAGRLSVRTPMQWDDDPNAGFSTGKPAKLHRPVVSGEFGPMAVNVKEQRGRADSLLTWMQRAILRRKETPEFGWGLLNVLDSGDPAVLAHSCRWEESTVLAIHNFSPEPRVVQVTLEPDAEEDLALDDLLDEGSVVEAEDGVLELKLDGYGHRWFRARRHGRPVTP